MSTTKRSGRFRRVLLLADGDSYVTITPNTGCSSRTIARWKHWFEASGLDGVQPHRLERYMHSTDPDFETQAADVIGLYLDPPRQAVRLLRR